jgi:drug/metabolite transporter (DMT)-like permease
MPDTSTTREDEDTAARPGQAATATLGRGVALACAAVFFFSLYNAISKALVVDYSPLQILFFRGLFGLIPVAAFVALAYRRAPRDTRLRSARPDLQLARAVTALSGTGCMILSYRFLPLADAVAISYAAPIFVTLLSVPLLSERVGLRRWLAVTVGFLGVLLVARPGGGTVDPAAGLAVLGALFYALCLIATRRLATVDGPECTMLHSTGFYALAGAAALPFVWTAPDGTALALFLALGLFAGLGMFLIVSAYRHADAAAIAPFDYLSMAWAVLFGLLVWGEVPTPSTVAGILVIAASGLMIVQRERHAHQR